jgi:membrane-associated phospholipid phosphatase
MRETGAFTFHASRAEPYTHLNVFLQPFPWMEAGFRYTSISNRRYGPTSLSGDQSYKDKGFDIKFSLVDETAWRPAVALGFRDIAGTGLFSGEFLVASKRWGDFDASLGVGWGNMAGASRAPAPGSQGGDFRFSNYFSGTPRAFAGLQWTTPWAPLVLKAEYDGNTYQAEPLGNRFEQQSKINLGLTYRIYDWLDLTAGYERGNTFNIGLSLRPNFARLQTPKLDDAPRIAVSPQRPRVAPDWARTAQDLAAQTNWRIGQIRAADRQLTVAVEEPDGAYWQDRVDRAASVLHRDAPAEVERFVLRYRQHGLELSEQVIDRSRWVDARLQPLPPSRQAGAVLARPPASAAEGAPQYQAQPAALKSNFRIGYAQNIGGPDSFILYQVYAEQSARLQLGRADTWLSGAARLRLLDNYDSFQYTAPSNLPRVRTFLREYLTTADLTLPNLQLTHVRQWSANQYVSVYGGYLEEMFAGIGGEWLYRPYGSRFAYGIDANVVRQRDFRQDFALRDPAYRVATGHATAYWDTGWQGVDVRVSVGRYLAKDYGATVEVSKRFDNGVVFGAFATKTNVSAQQFGEGSFDKGVFVSIPYDAMFTRSSGSTANFEWKPLTRDGGAKLWRMERLYDITRSRDLRTFETRPAQPPNSELPPADHQPGWQPAAQAAAVPTVVAAPLPAADWRADSDGAFRLQAALDRQGFRNVAVGYDGAHRLNLKLAHDTLRPASRAVGRAARTALQLAPAEVREIRIQFAERTEPLIEYEFFDLPRLRAHFAGELPVAALRDGVAVRYLNPGAKVDDPLAQLADVSRDPVAPSLVDVLPRVYEPRRVLDDFSAAAVQARKVDWLNFAGVGLAAVAGSSLLDRRGLSFARDHAGKGWLKNFNRFGDALPWIGFAGAGLAALDTSDPRRSRTGYAAVEAGASALLVATGLKYAVGRARPNSGLGRWDVDPFSGGSNRDAFPSRHSAVAWAVATPFALEYRAPWLYGVAALTNLSRVGKQAHWFSDTVAGSVIGYGLGRLFWEASRENSALPQVFVDPEGVNFSWTFY